MYAPQRARVLGAHARNDITYPEVQICYSEGILGVLQWRFDLLLLRFGKGPLLRIALHHDSPIVYRDAAFAQLRWRYALFVLRVYGATKLIAAALSVLAGRNRIFDEGAAHIGNQQISVTIKCLALAYHQTLYRRSRWTLSYVLSLNWIRDIINFGVIRTASLLLRTPFDIVWSVMRNTLMNTWHAQMGVTITCIFAPVLLVVGANMNSISSPLRFDPY